jgi:hypothetical protein
MAIIRNSDQDKEDKAITRRNNSINKDLDLLDRKMDGLYKDIYISRPDNKDNLDDILDNLDSTLDKLQGMDSSAAGMTELLKRVDGVDKNNSKDLMNSVQEMFNDQNLIGSMFKNEDIHKFIAAENNTYDMICKYLPKLQAALEIRRDNVLCSDNFSKDYINPLSGKSAKDESQKFDNNVDRIEREYDINEFFEKTYMNTSKYGEDFIYVVPYNTAFERLFKKSARRLNSARIGQVSLFEGYTGEDIITESLGTNKEFIRYANEYAVETENTKLNMSALNEFGVTLHFNTANIPTNIVNEYTVLKDFNDVDRFKSLSSIYEGSFGESFDESTEVIEEKKGGMSSIFSGVKKQNKKLATRGLANDGLIIPNNLDRDPSKLDKNFLGAVVERLPRENVLPIYIGKKCLGYYYFEFAENPNACGYCGQTHMTPGVGNGSRFAYETSTNQQELAIRFIASKISKSIDTKFINANKDLKEEIYAILNYNDKFDIARSNDIGVTFIPADDIIHTYFNFDENTHRGISDLKDAVVPSMLYILLYLTDIIGKITRSTDKRIYYVKQNVETNVARTMMNVVKQIKKGNMGMRQIESMNNILNIVGKYNDYIIPMGQSGEPPIQFEVMQGQDIQTPTDIMEKMEEMAVNTVCPYEFVTSTMQQDFAIRFSMSNSKFLKSVYTTQRKTQKFFSKIYTKIYNYTFGESNASIKIILPPPTYLSMNNNAQLFDNISQMADKIMESEMVDEEENVKMEWKRLYIRENLSTYIDFDMVARLLDNAKINIQANKQPSTQNGDGVDSDVSDMVDDEL